MLSKKNNVPLRKFLTTIHLVVSGRPPASPSGPMLYLLDKQRLKRKNSFYWTNLLTGWGNKRFQSVLIVRSTSRKITEILQTFITNYPPDAHYNLSASSVNSSQIPLIKILPWLTHRKPKKNKLMNLWVKQQCVIFHIIKMLEHLWCSFSCAHYQCIESCLDREELYQIDSWSKLIFLKQKKPQPGWASAVHAACSQGQWSSPSLLSYYRHSQGDQMASDEEANLQCDEIFLDTLSKALCLNSLFCRDSKSHLEVGIYCGL